MSILDKVKKAIKKIKEEVKQVEKYVEYEMVGVESKLDSLHLYHLNATKPQTDPQE